MSNLTCLRIMKTNYVDTDILASYSVSSEQVAQGFGIENAYNLNRRSKVWRSNGFFKVVSGSNTITINEGAGDLIATVAAGSYSNTAAFMTAVKNALDAAGLATYTVTQTANYKFSIASNLGGGATLFTIKWTVSSDMADLLGYDDAADDTGAATYVGDELRISDIVEGEFILWDMGLSTNPTCFIITDARNKPIKLSPNAVLTLQGNETNNFAAPSFSAVLTYDDEVICKISDLGLHTTGLRYWRFKIEDQNPLGFVQIGAIFLGDFFSPARGRANFPFKSQYVDKTQTVYSEGGQAFSDIFEQTQTFSIDWLGLTKSEMEEITELFRLYGTGLPFFVSFDTEAAFSTVQNRMIRFVKFSDEPSFNLVSPNNYSCAMSFVEQL